MLHNKENILLGHTHTVLLLATGLLRRSPWSMGSPVLPFLWFHLRMLQPSPAPTKQNMLAIRMGVCFSRLYYWMPWLVSVCCSYNQFWCEKVQLLWIFFAEEASEECHHARITTESSLPSLSPTSSKSKITASVPAPSISHISAINASPCVKSSQLSECNSDQQIVCASNDIRTKKHDVSKSMCM